MFLIISMEMFSPVSNKMDIVSNIFSNHLFLHVC
jgi:hypothetical protein